MNPIKKIKKAARNALNLFKDKHSLASEWNALRKAKLHGDAKLFGASGRVAIIGCGVMGRHIAKSTRLLPDWKVTAICDRQEEALKSVNSLAGGNAFTTTDLSALLENKGLFDVLAIATTAPSHIPIAMQSIESGVKAILLEKPVSNSLSSVSSLEAVAHAANCRIAVDHTRRWIAGGDGIKRLVNSGVIGRLVAIHAVPGRGGMAMIGTHFFDLARWIVGAEFQKVRAELDEVHRASHRGAEFLDPSGRCEAYFENGVRLTLDLSDSISMSHGFIVLIGDCGRLEVDERLGRIRLLGAGKRTWDREYAWPGLAGHGVAAALLELVGSAPVRCTLQDGAAALEVAIGCNISARENGRWIDLPLEGEHVQEVFAFA